MSGLDIYIWGEKKLDASISGWGHSRSKGMEAGEWQTTTGNLGRPACPLRGCVKGSRKREDGAERALSARLRGRDCCRGRSLASEHTIMSSLDEIVTTSYFHLSLRREFGPG